MNYDDWKLATPEEIYPIESDTRDLTLSEIFDETIGEVKDNEFIIEYVDELEGNIKDAIKDIDFLIDMLAQVENTNGLLVPKLNHLRLTLNKEKTKTVKI